MKLMTEAQIEQLARQHTAHYAGAQAVALTYLQALIFAVQAQLGRGRRVLTAEIQLAALERVEAPYYAAVLRGVITEDIADDLSIDKDERRRRMLARNSRSGFARSAKSTVVLFIQSGGDIRSVDVATVSKESLRRAVAPPEPVDRTERQIKRTSEGLQRALQRQARRDPAAARQSIEAIMEDLQTLLDSLEGAAETEPMPVAAERGPARTRVGVPSMGGRRVTQHAPHTP